MATNKTKTFYATRDFTDAGTTRRFAFGEEVKEAKPGELANYEAAGLISTEKPKSPADAEAATLDAVLG